MTELAPDYIHVKMTPQSSWQMKLLPTNDSTKVICVVATVCAPACDSHVKFYTTDWKELVASSYLPVLPVLDDFIAEAADTVDIYEYEDARRQADMLLMKADLSAKDATLAFTFTTTDYMGKEAAEKLKSFVRVLLFILGIKGSSGNPLLHFDSVESLSIDSDDCTL